MRGHGKAEVSVRAGIAVLKNSNSLPCIKDNVCCYLQVCEHRENADSKRDAL